MVGEMNKTVILWVGGAAAAAGVAYAIWKQKKEGIGYVDNVRIDEEGDANILPRDVKADPKAAPMAVHQAAHWATRQKKRVWVKDRDVTWGPDVQAPSAGGWSARKGSPIFTNTSKVRAPSWSLEAGRTCPAVAFPIRTMVEELKQTGLPKTNEELAKRISSEIPSKCLACYATGGNYMYDSGKVAQARRLEWWDKTPDDELVATMVDAIKHAGNTTCKIAAGDYTSTWKPKGNYSEIPGTKGCVFEPMTQPKYFRLFDSSDLHNGRTARLWRRIITEVNKGPTKTKFWIPTTAHKARCGDAQQSADQAEIIRELKLLAKNPYVMVRASADIVNQAAPRPFGHPGASVSDKPEIYPVYKENEESTKYGTFKPQFVNLDDEKGKPVKHWVCPGDCSVCRMCWNKTRPVVYPLHTKSVTEKNAIHMLARTFSATDCLSDKLSKRQRATCAKQDKIVRKILSRSVVTLDKIGPGK
jgi:hypothetical protein